MNRLQQEQRNLRIAVDSDNYELFERLDKDFAIFRDDDFSYALLTAPDDRFWDWALDHIWGATELASSG
jgi:hypothetical protein